MILYVNCCITSHKASRTLEISENFMEKLREKNPQEVFETVDLRKDKISFLNPESLHMRDKILESGDFSHPMLKYAKQFSEAQQIIISAPYWDLSFPAALKAYFENVSVCDMTFCSDGDRLRGICHAKRLIFITTAGGFVGNRNFGGDYIKGLCDFFGIPEFHEVMADGLDMPQTDINGAIKKAIEELNPLL